MDRSTLLPNSYFNSSRIEDRWCYFLCKKKFPGIYDYGFWLGELFPETEWNIKPGVGNYFNSLYQYLLSEGEKSLDALVKATEAVRNL